MDLLFLKLLRSHVATPTRFVAIVSPSLREFNSLARCCLDQQGSLFLPRYSARHRTFSPPRSIATPRESVHLLFSVASRCSFPPSRQGLLKQIAFFLPVSRPFRDAPSCHAFALARSLIKGSAFCADAYLLFSPPLACLGCCKPRRPPSSPRSFLPRSIYCLFPHACFSSPSRPPFVSFRGAATFSSPRKPLLSASRNSFFYAIFKTP